MILHDRGSPAAPARRWVRRLCLAGRRPALARPGAKPASRFQSDDW